MVAPGASPFSHRVVEMAPKRNAASAKAKAAPSAASAKKPVTPKKQSAAAASSSSLLEKQLAQASQNKKDDSDKVVADADMSRIVQKIIYDNFRSFSDEQVFQMVRDGQTLFGRLCRDKKRYDAGELTMGKHYYATNRALYRRDSDPMAKILPDRRLPKDDALEQAIGDLGKHCSDPSALLAWLQREELPNQRCCCALMKLVLCLDPYVGPSRCEVLMAILVWCHATDFPARHPELWQTVRSKFDQVLDKSWSLLKATGVGVKAWWSSIQPHGSLVLPQASWQKCIDHDGETWDSCHKELEVVMGSLAGSRLFAVPWKMVQAQAIDKLVSDSVVELFAKEKNITAAVLKSTRNTLNDKLKQTGDDLYSTFKPRPVTIKYRGCSSPSCSPATSTSTLAMCGPG